MVQTAQLTSVSATVSWGQAHEGSGARTVDIDSVAIVIDSSGKALSDQHLVFYNNLHDPSGAVTYSGVRTQPEAGPSSGEMRVELAKLPDDASGVSFAVCLDQTTGPTTFGAVDGAMMTLVDESSGERIANFDLSAGLPNDNASIYGQLYRASSGWRFRAMGIGVPDGVAGVVRMHGINAS